ncbi:MAG: PfkB family carbohydrate kinase [Bacteroidota bacterium]|nr:PfkB family carbohydrate kinase [Bacteroidota bacterium]MDP4232923.1 PfkB family carbohydrate kinase [Bacteroidota bacterium]MDP4241967.1 PfkB family carbohydrate kinase [Bacteroidota bacterium]MDP4286870.1 PfkB family carbohydrate kinase [Bacteroidota bacterium]
MSLLVVGSLALDIIETPFAARKDALGGSATFISLAASYFSPESVGVVGVVGEDFPERAWKLFRKREIDTTGIEVVPGGKTFSWHGRYHYDMNTRDTIATNLNVFADFRPVIPAKYSSPSFLVLGNIQPDLQLDVIRQLKRVPKLTLLDTMNFWITGFREGLENTLRYTNALVLNDSEARLLIDHPSLIVAGRRLQQMLAPGDIRIVVIKKGEHGALLFYNEHLFSAPAFPLEDIFDPTGAGDTFMGGFIGYLAKRESVSYEDAKRAVIYGTVLASYACSKFSTEGIEDLTMEEIVERFRLLRTLSAFDFEENA